MGEFEKYFREEGLKEGLKKGIEEGRKAGVEEESIDEKREGQCSRGYEDFGCTI